MYVYMYIYIYIYIYIFIYHVFVDRVVWCNPLTFFNLLIVGNNTFAVDVPFWRNQKIDLHDQGLKTVLD